MNTGNLRIEREADDIAAGERFYLVKWYLDCVGEHGEALIAYWAELRWHRLALSYASVMLFADGNLRDRSTLHTGQAPKLGRDLVEWSCDALDAHGFWKASTEPSIGRVLYRRKKGVLQWHCLQPLAEASVRCGKQEVSGSGYTECLTSTLAPWRLPIEELRWGRAHFPGHSVVWIDWTGPEPMRLVLVDARESVGTQVTDTLVSTPTTTVTLSGQRVLRRGPVGGSSLGSIPGVGKAISRTGLLIDEQKWLSSAMLEEGGMTLHGSAIHEVVRWR
ncbi:MAG TPA: hypothetical protein VE398_10120 [Acidobacteriota bacterium]|nr:hypothetical protein [Acidobacteriota bacterium]